MINDDPPTKHHGSLCGRDTERSHTQEDEYERLSFNPKSHIHTHISLYNFVSGYPHMAPSPDLYLVVLLNIKPVLNPQVEGISHTA